jgi:HAMP domain-containing protein
MLDDSETWLGTIRASGPRVDSGVGCVFARPGDRWLAEPAGISQARNAAVGQSEATLLAQAERTLQERALDKAELYDRTLLNIQRQVQTVTDVAVQAFGTPRDQLPPPRIDLIWLTGTGAVANPPVNLRTTIAQAQPIVDALVSQVNINPLISLGYLSTENGVSVFNDSTIVSHLPEGFDATTRPWYTAAVAQGAPIWTDAYVDAVTRQLNISAAAPVYVDGRLVGVVGMDILLTTIQSDVLRLNKDTGGYAFVMDDSGDIIVRPELDVGSTRWDETFKTANLFSSSDPGLMAVADRIKQHQSGVQRLELDGGARYLAYAPMETTGWIVGLVLPIDEVVAPARTAGLAIQAKQDQLRNDLIVAFLITCGFVVALASALASTIIRPLRKLDEGAQRIASGQLDQQLLVQRDDEIGRLSASFNQMTVALREKVAALETSAQQMAAINETSNELKRLRSLGAVLDQIPILLCKRLGFDRAVLYLVRDQQLEVVSVSFGEGHDTVAQQFLQATLADPITLDSSTIEAGRRSVAPGGDR